MRRVCLSEETDVAAEVPGHFADDFGVLSEDRDHYPHYVLVVWKQGCFKSLQTIHPF